MDSPTTSEGWAVENDVLALMEPGVEPDREIGVKGTPATGRESSGDDGRVRSNDSVGDPDCCKTSRKEGRGEGKRDVDDWKDRPWHSRATMITRPASRFITPWSVRRVFVVG